MLEKLCVELGFCLSPLVRDQLAKAPPDDANEFARAVFTAEGLNPDAADRHLFRQVRDYIADAKRQSLIEAEGG